MREPRQHKFESPKNNQEIDKKAPTRNKVIVNKNQKEQLNFRDNLMLK